MYIYNIKFLHYVLVIGILVLGIARHTDIIHSIIVIMHTKYLYFYFWRFTLTNI